MIWQRSLNSRERGRERSLTAALLQVRALSLSVSAYLTRTLARTPNELDTLTQFLLPLDRSPHPALPSLSVSVCMCIVHNSD